MFFVSIEDVFTVFDRFRSLFVPRWNEFELLEVFLILGMAKSAVSVMMQTKLPSAVFIEASWIGFASV